MQREFSFKSVQNASSSSDQSRCLQPTQVIRGISQLDIGSDASHQPSSETDTSENNEAKEANLSSDRRKEVLEELLKECAAEALGSILSRPLDVVTDKTRDRYIDKSSAAFA